MTFIFYLLAVWGLTHILVSSKIFEGPRNWLLISFPFFGEMLNCYQCTSFWASMFLYFFFNDLHIDAVSFPIMNGYRIGADVFLWGFIGSGVISFMSVIMSILIKRNK